MMTTTEENDGKNLTYIVRCVESKWQRDGEPCRFGAYEEGGIYQCNDPCKICKSGKSLVRCDKVYNKNTGYIYACDESGWKRDYSCTNDMIDDSSVSVDNTMFNTFKEDGLNDETALVSGHYGECNQEKQPDYCTVLEKESIYRSCENGQMVVSVDNEDNSCKRFDDSKYQKAVCPDDYAQSIYVDLNSNRYHCGECGHQCTSSQYCGMKDGNIGCQFYPIECDDDGYAELATASRIIHAYCIGNTEDLKKLGKISNNYDNAYVLTKDIDIDEEWMPVGSNDENAFSGILFGNDKTIRFKKGIKESTYMGLFGVIKNAHVEHLKLDYERSESLTVEIDPSVEITSYFGLLAGKVIDSVLESIHVDDVDIAINYIDPHTEVPDNSCESTSTKALAKLACGGLTGELDKTQVKDSSLNRVNLSIKMKMNDVNEENSGHFAHFGTLSGRTLNHSVIDNVSVNTGEEDHEKNSEMRIYYHTDFNSLFAMGGLVGFSSETSFNNTHTQHVNIVPKEVR